jgi:tetratricopeptide (TPR) repeat protein
VALPRIYLNHLPDLDWLIALEFGRTDDGQPRERWVGLTPHVGVLLDEPGGDPVGFKVTALAHFDEEAAESDLIWEAPRFHAPQAGLPDASIGEIVLAARCLFGDEPTVNRDFFSAGIAAQGAAALEHWRSCLEAGDCMAHFALGYTMYDLGRHHEAYRHLRYYAGIAPAGAWNWCWLGKAAQAIGEIDEARAAFHRALSLEPSDQETDAAELLEALEEEHGRS